MRHFSEMFKEMRQEKGLSTQQFATLFNLTVRTIQYYESGERFPDFHGLIALADYFNVSLDYLVGRSDNRDRK